MARLLRRSQRIKERRERDMRAGSSSKLPNDMLVEIQSRLGAKPFHRLKAVSKVWCSLSSRAFLHNKNLQDPPVLGLFHNVLLKETNITDTVVLENLLDNTNEVDVTLNAFQHYEHITLKDCCNGYLLLCCWNSNSPRNLQYYAYNPANRKSITIPQPKRYKHHNYINDELSLAYDPAIHAEVYVIWFRKALNNEVFYTFLHTFSSKKCRWTTGKQLWPFSLFWENDRSIYVRGRVYRLTWRQELFCLNPKDGTGMLKQLPNVVIGPIVVSGAKSLWQSQGLLNYISSDRDGILRIWESRNIEKNEWVLKYQVNDTVDMWRPSWYIGSYGGLGFRFVNNQNCGLAKVIAYHPEEDVIYIPTRSRRLCSLNLKTGELSEICDLPYGGQLKFWVYKPCYM